MSIVKTLTPDNIGSTLEVKNQKLEVKNLPIVPYGSWETITKTDPAAAAILIQTKTGELLKVPAAGSLFQFLSVSIHSTSPNTAVGEDRLVTITVQNVSTTDVESATLNINLGYPYSADGHQPIYSASYNGSSSSTGSVSVENSQYEPTAGQFSYQLGNIARGAVVRLVFRMTLQTIVSHTISATVSINNPHISSSESSHRATLTLTASRSYTHEEPNLPSVECPLPLVTHVATGKTLRLAREDNITTDLINGFSEDQLPVKIKLPARYSIRTYSSRDILGMFNGTWGFSSGGVSVSAELVDEAGMQIVTLSTKGSVALRLLDTQQTNCQPVDIPIAIFERKAFDNSGDLPNEVKTAIRNAGTMPVVLRKIQRTKITGQPPINSFFQEDFSDGYYDSNQPEYIVYSDNRVWLKSPQYDTILMPAARSSQFLQDIQSGALSLDGLTLGALLDKTGGDVNDKVRYFLNKYGGYENSFAASYLGSRVLPRILPDSHYEDTQSIISPYMAVASTWVEDTHFIAIKAGTPEGTYYTNNSYNPLIIKVVNQLPEYP